MLTYTALRLFSRLLLILALLVGVSVARAQTPSVAQLDALCASPGGVAEAAPRSSLEQRSIDDLTQLGPEIEQNARGVETSTELKACATELEKLKTKIELRLASSQTLCDQRKAQGKGLGAPDVLADTNVRAAEVTLSAKLKLPKPAALDECRGRAKPLQEATRGWTDAVDRFCPFESACSNTPAQQAAVQKVCSAYLSNQLLPLGELRAAAGCAPRVSASSSRGVDTAPGSARAPGAGERGLSGGELQTAILQGVADFFVQRAEQELSLFAAETVALHLCAKKVKPFLTNTCGLLDPDGDEPVLGATPAALRETLRVDLDALPDRIAEEAAKTGPEVACGVAFGWAAAREIINGASAADLLSDPDSVLAQPFVEKYCGSLKKSEPASLAQKIHELAEAIRSALQDAKSQSADAVRSARINAVISVSQDRSPAGALIANDGKLSAMGEVARDVLWRLRELDRAIKAWEKEHTEANRAVAIAAGIKVVEPVLLYVVQLAPAKTSEAAANRKADVLAAINLGIQVANHEYVRAVVTLTSLNVLKDKATKQVRSALTLAGSLAQASSSEEVQDAMNAAALPLQSWRRKNLSRVGVTLTGVVGFVGAREMVLEKVRKDVTVSSGLSLAPALLVGADLHYGLSKSWRVGLNLSVLDLGALASIRLDEPKVEGGEPNDTALQNPKLKLEQVLAPTVFPYLGVGPIEFGPALGFVPSLRAEKDAAGNTRALDVVRVGFLLGVDVSVLPLL